MRTCWEIRHNLLVRSSHDKNGWVVDCTDCGVYAGDKSCWEQCAGSPCCCAPLHVTCDFCEIYIEHRREIAGLLNAGEQPEAVAPAPRKHEESSSHPRGGKRIMEKVQFGVPRLWADHHTLKVREVLTQMAGVQDVVASSAFRMVAMSYDPAVTSPEAIAASLALAGYPVVEDGKGVVTQPVPVADGRKDPAWDRLGFRVTRTDPRDVVKK
jgi:hypothetical protein